MNETERHQPFADLLSAYALGSLEPDEAATVARHVATCPRCQAELADYEDVLAALATAVPDVTPSADLEDRLMARIQTQPKTTVSPTPSRWQKFIAALQQQPRWQPAFALILLLALIGTYLFWPQPAVVEFTLSPAAAAPAATGTLSADGEMLTLTVAGLPVLPPEQQYQLWLVNQDGEDTQREGGAVFSVDENGAATVPVTAKRPLTDYSAFGITIEPAGGSPGPTGDRVLGFNL